MSEEKNSKENLVDNSKDEELSKLLDSALQDFSDTQVSSSSSKNEGASSLEEIDNAPQTEAQWTDEFIKQAASQFESNFSNILGGSDSESLTTEQIQQTFEKMAEAASQVWINPDREPSQEVNNFASTISQTLRDLSEGSENVQAPFSEQDFMSMFGNVNSGEQNAFAPFMQGMMLSLLSKEVLYPSLKDILDKFPDWLESNKDNLTAEEREKYTKQKQLMEEVCAELEKESSSDTAETKNRQFEKVLGLMGKLQDYGQPPSDLVGDLGSGLPFDAQGNLDLGQQCCTM